MPQKTFLLRKEDAIREKKWHVVDASGQVLGRLATRVASILRGKHKPIYTPHADAGDHVIVINAERVRLTGRKLKDKIYYRHTGYPGGIKAPTAEEVMRKSPERIVEWAVKGMLPKNPLGRAMFRKLRVYAGSSHRHEAQKPEPLK